MKKITVSAAVVTASALLFLSDDTQANMKASSLNEFKYEIDESEMDKFLRDKEIHIVQLAVILAKPLKHYPGK
ncbi:hypothetical protein [Shouchella patagoniensis]|uniref:hypothetical protein n=1 Tax=Shouchella patagoniensis TaxID=228576 RepID=UPI0009958AD7|nr:hypothetical protein [Shouchella patagoniensis]